MIKTHSMVLAELKDYGAPANKVMRMVHGGELIPINRGIYETDRSVAPHLLAASIYGPSYVSFEYALSYHGLIPERVCVVTSATFEKKKRKTFENAFGTFTYRDVPSAAFPLGLQVIQEGSYAFRIACPEKALCDELYKMPPVSGAAELKSMLYEGLRIDPQGLEALDHELILSFEEAYRRTNVRLLCRLVRRGEL